MVGLFSGAALSAQDGATLSLETAKVISQPLEKTIALPGDLTAYQAVNIHAKVASFVESLPVDRGSWVRQGDRLVLLSAPELNSQRAEVEARLQSMRAQQLEAEAKALAAQSTYDRLKSAAATPGVVAGHDVEIAEKTLDAARAQADAAKNGVAAAEAAVKAVTDMESYLDLRAPFDGVITERNAHPGSLVGPAGNAILRIEQVSRLRLTVPVPEAYVARIDRGTRVNFRVSAFPDQTFQGVIARPAYSLDMKTRSMLVELDVSNPRLALAPGMFAEVQWPVARPQASLFVPTSALVRTSERQFVIRVRNNAAEWVDVRRGEVSGENIEVFGGLREGDVVVRRGNDEIRPGTRVTSGVVNR
jgi:RND family efflux transporter MFP subunit